MERKRSCVHVSTTMCVCGWGGWMRWPLPLSPLFPLSVCVAGSLRCALLSYLGCVRLCVDTHISIFLSPRTHTHTHWVAQSILRSVERTCSPYYTTPLFLSLLSFSLNDPTLLAPVARPTWGGQGRGRKKGHCPASQKVLCVCISSSLLLPSSPHTMCVRNRVCQIESNFLLLHRAQPQIFFSVMCTCVS